MKKIKKMILTVSTAAVFFLLASCQKGPSGPAGPAGINGVTMVNIQDGVYPDPAYAGATDTYIRSENPGNNYGACGTAMAGVTAPGSGGICSALLKFGTYDLLPAMTAVEFYLQLYVTQLSGSVTVRAYKASISWDEGPGSCAGAPGAAGGATWYNASSATAWAAPGGDLNAVAVSDAVTITNTGYVTFTMSGGSLQDWMDSYQANYGFIIKADEGTQAGNYAVFAAKEDATPALRPRLAVYYQPK